MAWLGKGRAIMSRGKTKRALRFLREAVRLDPRLAEARVALGEAFDATGMGKEAMREAKRAMALDPDSEAARVLARKLGVTVTEDRAKALPVEEPPSEHLTTTPPQAISAESDEEALEEIPGPGPALDQWFEEHSDDGEQKPED
jgi:tetratricopeptide (TPR) repeat protein